jgi:hypothetical protein
MMKLILPFPVVPSQEKISYSEQILFIGSCFTEEIGKKMADLKFRVLRNPNGILYDPISICAALDGYVTGKQYQMSDLFLKDHLWHSWHHHSAFSGLQQQAVLDKINGLQAAAHEFLQDASWLVITLGTSYHYILKDAYQPVANCHKAPAAWFEKKLIPLDQIAAALSETVKRLHLFNRQLKIIFTVSPVRHIKDGIIENSRSKARIIEAVHLMREKNARTYYFPAYEWIIDVLRDYRFYSSDLVHPSADAVGYVFEKFCDTFIDSPSTQLMDEIKKIRAAIDHRPFQKGSETYLEFKRSQLAKVTGLAESLPSLDFTEEKAFFESP